jgi:hypothetical protein
VNPPTTWDEVRGWFGLAFSGLTAMFAGLVWWLARKSLEPQVELIARQWGAAGTVFGELRVMNRSRTSVVVDHITAHQPPGMKIWSRFPVPPTAPMVSQRRDFHEGAPSLTVLSGDSAVLELELQLSVPRTPLSKLSISVRIARRSRVIRHKTKAITAILPESMRKA